MGESPLSNNNYKFTVVHLVYVAVVVFALQQATLQAVVFALKIVNSAYTRCWGCATMMFLFIQHYDLPLHQVP